MNTLSGVGQEEEVKPNIRKFFKKGLFMVRM
jgi:hypothetical protein